MKLVVQLTGIATRSFRLGAKAIYDQLRDQIVKRVYASNERIPSSRALAKELGVSRTTVCVAYEQLVAEGYIVVRQGARPRVAVSFPPADSLVLDSDQHEMGITSLSRYGAKLEEIKFLPRSSSQELIVDFHYGEIAAKDFPIALWRRALTSSLLRKTKVLAYGEPQGSCALRHMLQGYLWRARSINCHMDQIIIVSGSQQALDLLARILLDPEDSFVIENPSYAMARMTFEATGAKPIPVEVDSVGLDTSLLGGIRARLAYVTPSHQYPLGGIMSIERRLDLIAWAQWSNAWIVEDDYDGEYRYDVKPLPPLWAVNENNRVIYIGTVSKTLSPTLRIGYIVVPDALRDVLVTAKQLTDRHTALHDQEALANLIQNGAYERHIRSQRRLNHRRREALIGALRSKFGSRVNIEGTEAGLHLVVWFYDVPATREKELIERARSLGVGIYSVRPLCRPLLTSGRNDKIGLVMGYASLDPVWIVHGITLLWRATADMLY